MRFLTRTTSSEGPAGHDFNLLNEKRIDDFLVNVKGIAKAAAQVELTP